jgi:hypothetical protein
MSVKTVFWIDFSKKIQKKIQNPLFIRPLLLAQNVVCIVTQLIFYGLLFIINELQIIFFCNFKYSLMYICVSYATCYPHHVL